MSTERATLTFIVSPFLGATCSILSLGTDAIIVDPGLDVADEVRSHLTDNGLTPRAILVSHGHLDHVADASILGRELEIPVAVGSADRYRLDDPLGQLPSAFTSQIAPVWNARGWSAPPAIIEVTDGDDLTFGSLHLGVMSAPGHTEGSTLYTYDGEVDVRPRVGVAPSARQVGGVMFTGDVLFAGTIGRTDLHGGSADQMRASLGRLREVAIAHPHLLVVPGHGPVTTLGDEVVQNPFLQPSA
ncbi:MAG: MBL fold metallo-hydrolase [Dermabacter sp.]|nr:MBL fold metallo-hydrolase [Dermabacter sp.]